MGGNEQSSATRTVRSGEIWLIEQSPEHGLAALDREALQDANVILYDPALASLVATNLPLGTYAEPLLAHTRVAGSAISQRALRFAKDGWSVVQIVPAPDRAKGGEPSAAARDREALPFRVIPKVAGGAPVTLVFGPLAARGPAPSQAFTANGLAG